MACGTQVNCITSCSAWHPYIRADSEQCKPLRVDCNFVIENSGGGRVDPIQVEVAMLSQVDWSGFVCGCCHDNLHLVVLCQQVGHHCRQVARVPLHNKPHLSCWA